MNQKELQEKIALFYSKLPPNVQAVFSSMKWLETLKTISQKYGLNDKQIETLGTETTLVLLGIIHLVEYEEALTNELGLSRNSTEKMLIEIEESIIKTIRPQLVQAFETNKNSETEKNPNIRPELDARFETLPKETQNTLIELNYREKIYAIAKGYNLNVEQIGILETVATNLIIGVIHPDEFENSLESSLRLPSETVRKLANDVNEKIFKKIREALVKKTAKENEASKKSETNDTQVLNSAGIEIVSDLPTMPSLQSIQTEKLELTKGEEAIENREEILEKIERPAAYAISYGEPKETIHPILAQKLSSSVQTGMVKTDHTLENITKTIVPSSAPSAVPKPKIDPYREIPE